MYIYIKHCYVEGTTFVSILRVFIKHRRIKPLMG